MRQKVAKQIRQDAYGDHVSKGDHRKYHRNTDTGAIHAEPMRKRQQQLKQEHINGMPQPEPPRQKARRMHSAGRSKRRQAAMLRGKENAM